ncbi:MAG: hypothetical protein R6V15_07745 [Desulfotignum sp.]
MTGKKFQNRHIPAAAEEDSEDWTFLTPSQAVDAIAMDFTQYGPQPVLFASIAPLILGNRCTVIQEKEKPAVHILQGKAFIPVPDKNLGFYLIHMLETAPPDLETLAEICTQVFQTRTRAGPSGNKNISGIWVHSQMEAFVCSQCGQCCRSLAYENNCTAADYHLWQSLGRRDILAWVRKLSCPGKKDRYRIWVDPDTGKTAKTCPWLVPCPDSNRFSCAIQEIKPRICRQYPFTRKHAVMTGCRHTWR